jgi:hypothetical protein
MGLTELMLIQSCNAVMVVVSFARALSAQLVGESAMFPPRLDGTRHEFIENARPPCPSPRERTCEPDHAG